ncbi:MAG: spore coat protein CotJB [Clostridia bacterium]|nr:spore coat protein CotJB [Clostridia bacterium]
MLTAKEELYNKISATDFAIYDLVLFLDSHPQNVKATELLSAYRKQRESLINDYEQKYGDYITHVKDVKADNPWSWIDGPWPWEGTSDK